MKKLTTIIVMIFVSSLLTVAQNNDNKTTKGAWTLQFAHDITSGGTFQVGVGTDGNFYYVTRDFSADILKYDLNGNYISTFSIPGVMSLQDLTYDGTYFYGGRAGPWFWKMDFTNQTLVKTINSPTQLVRSIAYDPTHHAFWVGDWSTNNFLLIDTNGTVLNTINSATHGLSGISGTAFDNTSPGGPYLWALTGIQGSTPIIYQVDIASGLQTGIFHDLTVDNLAVSTGGGLFIHPDIITGTTTLGGLVKGNTIFGYDLSSTEPLALDAELQTLDVNAMVQHNSPTPFSGIIRNAGYTTIDTLDLSWSIDGGPVHAYSMTNLNLTPFSTYNYTHPDIWTPVNLGPHTITIWVSDPNGSVDLNTSNDTIIKNVVSVDIAQRKLLHEVFTSSTCGPCLPGNQNLQAVLDLNPGKWTCVKYQMSWPSPGDPYYTAEGGVRKDYYTVSGVPNMALDGGWNDNPNSYDQTIFDQYYDVPAFLNIDAYHQIINDSVYVDVYLDPLADFTSSDMKLHIAVVENKTEGNIGNNGEFEFHYVMMKMVPDALGTNVPLLTNGVTANYKSSASLFGTYIEEMTDLSVVVFLQDNATTEVHQSCWSIEGSVGTDDKEMTNDGFSGLYPNPAREKAIIEFNLSDNSKVNIEVFNIIGEKVYSIDKGVLKQGIYNQEIDLHDLNTGIYFVKLQIDDAAYTKKLNIN